MKKLIKPANVNFTPAEFKCISYERYEKRIHHQQVLILDFGLMGQLGFVPKKKAVTETTTYLSSLFNIRSDMTCAMKAR